MLSSSPTIQHCRIAQNQADRGGGMYLCNGSPLIRETVFHNNSAYHGGAIYCKSASPTFEKITMYFNQATRKDGGGAIYLNESTAVFRNALLFENFAAYDGGAFYCENSSADIRNATMYHNSAERNGGAILFDGLNNVKIKNSILWDNRAGDGSNFALFGEDALLNQFEISYSDVDTSFAHWMTGARFNASNILWSYGNQSENPLFRDANNFDFTLLPESPCIDGSDPSEAIGEEPKPNGYCVNMGCFGGTSLAATTNKISLTVSPDPINFGSLNFHDMERELPVYLKNGTTGAIHISEIISENTNVFKIGNFSGSSWNLLQGLTLNSGQIDSFKATFTKIPGMKEKIESSLSIHSAECPTKIVKLIADTRFRGNISGVFSADASPYKIYGDVNIAKGDSLLIEPGVKLIFMGQYRFTIGNGTKLKAAGTESDSITFCAADTSIGWGGLFFTETGSDDTLIYCNIRNCRATSQYPKFSGSGIYAKNSSPFIAFTQISHNHAVAGGALLLESSNPIITNSLLCFNSAEVSGGALQCSGSKPLLVNVTIAENSADVSAGAISLAGSNRVLFRNSIISQNHSDNGSLIAFAYTGGYTDIAEFHYSTIDTTNATWLYNTQMPAGIVKFGTENQFASPLFADSLYFMLNGDSPCIDAGDPNMSVGHEPTPNGYRINQGAYGGTSRAAITTTAMLTVSPDPLNFGTVEFFDKKILPIYLKNGSPSAIHLTSVALEQTEYFSILNVPHTLRNVEVYALAPGQIDSIQIRFYYNELIEKNISTILNLETLEIPPKSLAISAKAIAGDALSHWQLSQNFPNPFNDCTVIRFQVPATIFVSVRIYNMLGQQTKTLLEKVIQPGPHHALWDGTNDNGENVSTGIYLYKIQSINFTCVKKMVYIR